MFNQPTSTSSRKDFKLMHKVHLPQLMNWRYETDVWPHVSDSGSADVTIDSTTISISASITPTSDGRATIAILSDSVSIGNLDIELHGGASWLYQIFVDVFNSDLKSAVASAMQSALSDNVAQLVNSLLETVPVVETIYNNVEVDFGLVNLGFQAGAFVETDHTGEFYEVSNPQEAPFDRPVIPDFTPSQMILVAGSDFFLNSGGYAFYTAGVLQTLVTPDMVPSSSPLQLNTSSFCSIVPRLCKVAPNQNMSLYLNATSTPVISINTSGIQGQFEGTILFNINFDNGTVSPAFTLSTSTSLNATAYFIQGSSVGGIVYYIESSLTLLSSEIGSVPIKLLQLEVDYIIKNVVLPQVNAFLATGIELPTIEGVTFVNPQIEYGEQYLSVSTDVVYNSDDLLLKLKLKK